MAACVVAASVLLLTPWLPAKATGGTRLWTARYNGLANNTDVAVDLGVSPDGTRVFVTGRSLGSGSQPDYDYATIAYDAATGARLWLDRYNGPGNNFDAAAALGVSPDGTSVFVTGRSVGSGTSLDFATIAYDAVTGASLWTARYNGPMNGSDGAAALGVSPDGTRVFVTGWSFNSQYAAADYATIAYDAVTGDMLWVVTYNGPGGDTDNANSLAVSPNGAAVFVTGRSTGIGGDFDYATISYDAATGARLWKDRYKGPNQNIDEAQDAAVSADGMVVVVTGGSYGYQTLSDYATIAYDAKTGARLWASRYDGPGHTMDIATSLKVSPDGKSVFVTGASNGFQTLFDFATIAYDAVSGGRVWTVRYNGSANDADIARDLDVSPDGMMVFVTGDAYSSGRGTDYTTFAYDAGTGARLWTARYNGPGNLWDTPFAMALSPDGTTVYVTGGSFGSGTDSDYATIAIRR